MVDPAAQPKSGPSAGEAAIRWHGVFASRDWETRFCAEHLPEYVRRIRMVMGVVAIAFLVYLWNDYHFSGHTDIFGRLLAFRLGVVGLSILSMVRIHREMSMGGFNAIVMVWSSVSSVAMLYVGTTRPPDYMGNTIENVLMVLLTYLAVPLPLIWQTVSAGLFSCAILVLGFWLKPWPDEPTTVAMVVSLLTTNILGAGISRELQLWQRRHFVVLCHERELSATLEKALNEIKTLRGILPICMHCKKIRSDTGYWQQVEQYVTENTDAQFSHGLCPDCMKTVYPDVDWEELRRKRDEKSKS